MLEWIRIEFCKEKQSAKAIATDRFKLAIEEIPCEVAEEDFIVYIKPGIGKLTKTEYIKVELNDEKVFIYDGENIRGYSQPESDFIRYQSVLGSLNEKPVNLKISFNVDLLIEALISAIKSASDGQYAPITLEFRDKLSPVILRTGDSNIKLVMPLRTGE